MGKEVETGSKRGGLEKGSKRGGGRKRGWAGKW